MAGFIRLSRKYFEHNFWTEQRTFSPAEAWLDLIASARFESEPEKLLIRMKMIKINRGELRASVRFLAHRWGWSKDKVSRFLKLLAEDTMISRDKRHGETVIIILNYNKFNPANTEQRDSDKDSNKDEKETEVRTETGQQQGHAQGQTKEYKEIEESKESLFRQRFFPVLEIFYFKNFKNPVSVTNAFFNHYSGVGWKNSRGLPIENVDSVAENWDNKTTEGINCPPHLLVKWKVMYGILKNNTDHYTRFLLIRPAKLENNTLVIRGKQKDIAEIENDKALLAVWRNALRMSFGKVNISYELDKQAIA
ncbi:hypothetical protein [Draconibacterium sp.]|uniref:hypothetical protein n=1 Tax=Draconibacterium sp. TaxID=1965318 RepID=UPI003567CEDD